MLNKKSISILQISLIVIAIFAFAFTLSGNFVSAEDTATSGETQDTCESRGGTCLFSPCSSYGISLVFPNNCGSGKFCCSLTEYISSRESSEKEDFLSEADRDIMSEEFPEPEFEFQEGQAVDQGKTSVPTTSKYEESLKKRLGEEAYNRIMRDVTKRVKERINNTSEETEDGSKLGGLLGTFAKDIFKGYFRGFNRNYQIYTPKMLKDLGGEKEVMSTLEEKIAEKVGRKATDEVIQKEAAKQLSKSTISQTAVYVNSFAWAMTGAKIYLQAIQLFGAGERNVRTIQKSQIASIPLGTAAGILAVGAGIPGPGWIAAGVSVAVMGIWTVFTLQDYSREVFVYDVQGWQPPIGGENCYKCKDLRYGCSEYQCHTFGTACELINIGSEDEACVWVNENDMNPPEISQLDILDEGFSFSPSDKVTYPNRGVDLLYNGNCIEPFTSVKFAVKTDEPAQCKIDLKRNHFDNMTSYMNEGSRFTENHTMEIPASAIPSSSALEGVGWSVDAGKDYSFYISCMDYNGNLAPYHFVVNFCVDDGPDTSPPIITGTNYRSGEFIKAGLNSLRDFEVYTNEPAECKWDFNDMDYDSMSYEFSECSKEIGDYLFDSTLTYGCRGTIDGLKDRVRNTYYIRCKDKPWLIEGENEKEVRVANKQSYVLSLIGTEELSIDSILINGFESGATIKDSTNNIKATLSVKTFGGAEEGLARCTYRGSKDSLFYDFFNEDGIEYKYLNEHDLRLGEGNYLYYLMCFDRGGNVAEGNISFTIDIDQDPPIITRAYYENNRIVLVTNEEATCAYNTNTCDQSYDDSIKISSTDSITHYLAWDTEQNLYLKCEDEYLNRANAEQCMTVRGHNLFQLD